MEPLPTFELFPDPMRERIFEASTDPCDLCKKARGFIYNAGCFGTPTNADPLYICPWCIADGTAGSKGLTFNDATMYPDIESTPKMNEADRELVEQRTPGFVTWQQRGWFVCCGRACVYLGEAFPGDLQGRWASAIPKIFADTKLPKADIDKIVSLVGNGDPGAFVFQCRICKELTGFWDRS